MALETEEKRLILSLKDELSASLDKINKSLKTTEEQGKDNINVFTKVKSTWKDLSTSIMAGLMVWNQVRQTIGNVYRRLADFMELAREAALIEARFNAVLEASGMRLRLLDVDFNNIAETMASRTLFDNDDILQAEMYIGVMENISSETFPRVLQAASDLASMLGTNMTSAAEKLSLALEAPDQAARQLRSMFILLSDEQKNAIKTFLDMNDIASAQEIILGEVEDRVSGVSEKIAETAAGTFEQFKKSVVELKESFGLLLLESFQPMLANLTTLAEKLKAATDEQRNLARAIMGTYQVDTGTQLQSDIDALQNYIDIMGTAPAGIGDVWRQIVTQFKSSFTALLSGSDPLNLERAKVLMEQMKARQRFVNSLDISALGFGGLGGTGGSTAPAGGGGAVASLPEIIGLNATGLLADMNARAIVLVEGLQKTRDIAISNVEAFFNDIIGTTINIIKTNAKEALSAGGAPYEILDAFFTGIEEDVKAMVDIVSETLSLMTDPTFWVDIETAIQGTWDAIINGLSTILSDPKAASAFAGFIAILTSNLKDALTTVLAEIPGIIDTIVGFATDPMVLVGLEAAFGNILAMVEMLLPIMGNIAVIGGSVFVAVAALSDIFQGMNDILGPAIDAVFKPFHAVMKALGNMIGTLILPLLKPLQVVMSDIGDILMTVLKPIFDALLPVFRLLAVLLEPLEPIISLLNIVLSPLYVTLNAISVLIQTVLNPVIAGLEGTMKGLATVFDSVNAAITKAWKDFLNGFIDLINSFFANMRGFDVFGWKPFEGLADIPKFEKGGYVPHDMIAMVHKGEYVVPAGGGAQTITVNAPNAKVIDRRWAEEWLMPALAAVRA